MSVKLEILFFVVLCPFLKVRCSGPMSSFLIRTSVTYDEAFPIDFFANPIDACSLSVCKGHDAGRLVYVAEHIGERWTPYIERAYFIVLHGDTYVYISILQTL